MEEYQERQAKSVLRGYGWNPETGLLREGAAAPEGILPPLEEAPDSRIACLIDDIHEKREGRARIPEESKKPYDVESPDEAVVEVCLDGVKRASSDETGRTTSKGGDIRSAHKGKRKEVYSHRA